MMKLVLEWLKSKGGLAGIEKINTAKKDLLYGAMDAAPDFYRGTAEKDSRSMMNVTMRMPTEELENKFIAAGREGRLDGIERPSFCRRHSLLDLQCGISGRYPEDCGVHGQIPQS